MEVSTEQEINQIEVGKPHVVILGAGASYAAFPNGDKNRKKLPLMNNFVETLGIEELIERALKSEADIKAGRVMIQKEFENAE